MPFWKRRQGASPEVRGPTAETETVTVGAENFLQFFGVNARGGLSALTIDEALDVPAVWCAVSFLSRTLATVPLHAYRRAADGPQRAGGRLEAVIHEAPNPTMGAEKFWRWFWQQVFTGGRGLAWIERRGREVEAIWPIDPSRASISWDGPRLVYSLVGREYDAADVIDVPFMLKSNGVDHYGPLAKAGGKAAQLSAAMNTYAATFFAGGGIPPLALSGPLPNGAEAMKRAMSDIHRAIQTAKETDKALFPMPPGHELKPVGFDPEKGQMTEARRFQVEEVARAYQLPPVFLQDLSRATFSNAEQQDLHLVKHLIGQWCQALEDELNLKLFGQRSGRYVEHNLDGLMRGDFKSRIEGIAQGIQAGLLTPNEGRRLENRPNHSNPAADDLHMQGAMMPMGSQVQNGGGNEPGEAGANGAA